MESRNKNNLAKSVANHCLTLGLGRSAPLSAGLKLTIKRPVLIKLNIKETLEIKLLKCRAIRSASA